MGGILVDEVTVAAAQVALFGQDKRNLHGVAVAVLIDAMPAVCRAVPDAQLIIGGRGPIKRELTAQVEELGLTGSVTLAGYIDDARKAALYEEARAAVFPSLYEPFGIVALEAMAAGTPVIVSDVGGLTEIVADGATGLKVAPGDAPALADAIIRILQDPALGKRLGAAAIQEIEARYTWDRVARLTCEQYRRIAPAARQEKVV
jgi:glycosyltransferase involved in cell wall biosynthesis